MRCAFARRHKGRFTRAQHMACIRAMTAIGVCGVYGIECIFFLLLPYVIHMRDATDEPLWIFRVLRGRANGATMFPPATTNGEPTRNRSACECMRFCAFQLNSNENATKKMLIFPLNMLGSFAFIEFIQYYFHWENQKKKLFIRFYSFTGETANVCAALGCIARIE